MILEVERFSAGHVSGNLHYTKLELTSKKQGVPFTTGDEVVVLSRKEFNELYDCSSYRPDRLQDIRYMEAK